MSATEGKPELFEFEMASTPMIVDLDLVGTGEEGQRKKITTSENRTVKRSTTEIPKSLAKESVQKETSRGGGELHKETQRSSDPEKGDNFGRQSKVAEAEADRLSDRHESRSEVEKCKGDEKSRRTKSMSPGLCKPIVQSRGSDERRPAVATEVQPSRWSEDPNVYRGSRSRFEYAESRHSYSDREIQLSSNTRSRREEPSFRGRPSERFGTRILLGNDQHDFLLPPPSAYFGSVCLQMSQHGQGVASMPMLPSHTGADHPSDVVTSSNKNSLPVAPRLEDF